MILLKMQLKWTSVLKYLIIRPIIGIYLFKFLSWKSERECSSIYSSYLFAFSLYFFDHKNLFAPSIAKGNKWQPFVRKLM